MGEFEADLLLVMRVYFEKPRTTVGWKGDPPSPISSWLLAYHPPPAKNNNTKST